MVASSGIFIDHVKVLRRACQAVGAELVFAGETLAALVRRGDRHAVLYPQFLMVQDGEVRRTPALHDQSQIFLGFLPYPSRLWPIALDKLAFKRHAHAAGLPVPDLSDATDGAPVIVRRARPSFEPFARGPFRNANEHVLDRETGEYYERYVAGDALTVWFWNGHPVCAVVVPTPTIVGDGKSPIGELLVRVANRGGTLSPRDLQLQLAETTVLARCAGLELSSVLPDGARFATGIGHGSPLLTTRPYLLVDLAARPEPTWVPVLRKAGQLLQAAIPEEIRSGTLFAVNATLDVQGAPWLHDMDASPYVHPLSYGPILRTILAADATPAAEQRT